MAKQYDNFNLWLTRERIRKGISTSQLAILTGLSMRAIQDIESGGSRGSRTTRAKIELALNESFNPLPQQGQDTITTTPTNLDLTGLFHDYVSKFLSKPKNLPLLQALLKMGAEKNWPDKAAVKKAVILAETKIEMDQDEWLGILKVLSPSSPNIK